MKDKILKLLDNLEVQFQLDGHYTNIIVHKQEVAEAIENLYAKEIKEIKELKEHISELGWRLSNECRTN